MSGDNVRALRLLRAERIRLMDALERESRERGEYEGARRLGMIKRLDSLTRTIALAEISASGLTCWRGEV